MNTQSEKLDIVIVGGGMITQDQILPSLYQLQRQDVIGAIKICALNSAPLAVLAESKRFADAFPGQGFEPYPSLDVPPDQMHPDLFKEVIASLPPGNMVVVAVPDHFHDPVVRLALENDQHVLAVKPLVPTYAEAAEIEELASAKGRFVGVEYHKRFDRRALDARGLYRAGRFGEFRCGEAKMIEPYYYRHSNFQNWFTKENSDPFTYVGCHYVDLVYFITGLRPVEVSVRGVEGTFPNGNVGYMWAQGRVVWENGALLSITDGLGYPDEAAGTNDQCLVMYCEGDDCGAILKHDDQYRGVRHGYVDRQAGTMFRFVSPDYFRMVPWEGDGLKPVGYGFESIEGLILGAKRVNAAADGLAGQEALAARQRVLLEIDDRGILATPSNSSINELVTEAARLSIARDGQPALIEYAPSPGVRLRT
ncbi:MAG: Gfo/Idh/MocA family oxidoreductase [Planctomycetes bacterium]|nr:Gfo/Idh/MocA family oxidoreductase [Planctomycetota bacterium]MBL7041164.1 Gfo/Idh/MocA family oxidoreductase [Pirellulaceae bacterium]